MPSDCADGVTGDGHSLEYKIRPLGQNDAVLERAGFSLVGVADDIFLLTLGGRGQIPFHPGWKTGSAASLHARFADRAYYSHAVHGERRFKSRVDLDRSQGHFITDRHSTCSSSVCGVCGPKTRSQAARMPWTVSGVTRVNT